MDIHLSVCMCIFILSVTSGNITLTRFYDVSESAHFNRRKVELNDYKDSHELGIIGGKITNITQHPYQVSIDSGKDFVCAGALLNRIWVITLASCTCGCKVHDLVVRVGSSNNLSGGSRINVTEILLHPQFNYSTLDYDFSLLKLVTYLCFDAKVSNIGFSQSPPRASVTGVISGWGFDYGDKKYAFRQLSMRTVSHSYCSRKYKVANNSITSRMFCAVRGSSGPCYDDFGDPFVVNGTLYGLFSWSRGCARPNFPAVFASLASVKDWIVTTMNNACTCGLY